MKSEDNTKNLSVIYDLLQKNGLVMSNTSTLQVTAMAGDGSSRKFWRITDGSKKLCLAVAPPNMDVANMAEARAARAIGLHLLRKNCPVPMHYGWDEASGVLLFEDFGDCKLHEYVLQNVGDNSSPDTIRLQYKKILKALVDMQVKAADSFVVDWCWDTPRYDKELMLERESGYFLTAFWQGLLGKKIPAGLQQEFEDLASRAAVISAHFFLHRDFQSRNIMIHNHQPGFIDFQGGRLGPLAYDLASLLQDPYVALDRELKEEFLDFYLDMVIKQKLVQRTEFQQEYMLLAVHRNLQIIGAFSFLSEQREKPFFRQFLRPAIDSLQELTQQSFFNEYPVLKKCVKVCGQEFIK